MRYSLHEVLDIGLYTVKQVSWVVKEIEQLGTWHASIGHEYSMSAKRYLFDLDLLYKDLVIYDHDPHVHYYLGVTHQAFVEKSIAKEGALTNITSDHLERSIKYLTLRILSEYEDDFVEQRWSAMVLLGSIYGHLRFDFTLAERWLSACRDYNPKQSECSMALTRLYYSYGSIDLAYKEVKRMIKVNNEQRLMLNWFRNWACDAPTLTLQVLKQILLIYPTKVTAGDALYVLLLRKMLENPLCNSQPQTLRFSDALLSSINGLVLKMPSSRGAKLLSVYSSQSELCDSGELSRYLIVRGYKLHPCNVLKEQEDLEKECQAFLYVMQSPNEVRIHLKASKS
jgi:hypothetical protein